MRPSRSDFCAYTNRASPVSELTAMFGVSRSTLFRTLKVLKFGGVGISVNEWSRESAF
jgi:hypothetical protein